MNSTTGSDISTASNSKKRGRRTKSELMAASAAKRVKLDFRHRNTFFASVLYVILHNGLKVLTIGHSSRPIKVTTLLEKKHQRCMGILITNSVPMRPFPSIPIVQQDFQEYEKYLTIFLSQ